MKRTELQIDEEHNKNNPYFMVGSIDCANGEIVSGDVRNTSDPKPQVPKRCIVKVQISLDGYRHPVYSKPVLILNKDRSLHEMVLCTDELKARVDNDIKAYFRIDSEMFNNSGVVILLDRVPNPGW